MSYLLEKIADRLKQAREEKGLSQRALADLTGLPQSHISKIESGGVDIRLSSLIEIARALELELELVPRPALPAVQAIIRQGINPRENAPFRVPNVFAAKPSNHRNRESVGPASRQIYLWRENDDD